MVQKSAVGLAVFGILALVLPLICVFAAHRRWRAGHRSRLEQSPTMEELVREPSTAASDAMTRVGTDDALKPLMHHSSENAPDDVASSKGTSTLDCDIESPPQLPKIRLQAPAMAQLSAEPRPAICRSVSAVDEPKFLSQQPRRATFGSGPVGATAPLPQTSATAVGRARGD